jgi:hypothetical protein
MVSGMSTFQFNHNSICKGCMLGKSIKKYFPVSNKMAKVILELIHSDVCGPMPAPSLNGHVYYVIFIDDFSRKSWIYFMKTKNEIFKCFMSSRI